MFFLAVSAFLIFNFLHIANKVRSNGFCKFAKAANTANLFNVADM